MKIGINFLGSIKGKAGLLVVGLFEGAALSKSLDPAVHELLKQAIAKKRFTGKAGESLSVFHPTLAHADEVLFIGLGKPAAWSYPKLKREIASAYNASKARHAKTLSIFVDSFVGGPVKLDRAAEFVPETIGLAEYRFDKYFFPKKDQPKAEAPAVELLYAKAGQKAALAKALERSQVIADAVNFTRNLINEPANVMSPQEMASQAKAVAREQGLKCQVLGLAEIKKLKMGGIIAVSQGSAHPPQLIVMEYGTSHKSKGTVCLVGKGVTFDTGGISIKPSKDMEKMKYDMSGAACVIGTMKALAQLRPAVHVVGIAPCVENMPSGTAQRPGDIIKLMNGKSVEVINTDAEGRLILGDALAYTERFKPKAIIDLATLTGAVAVALADKAMGVMGTDPALVQKIIKAGEITGERGWELPLWEEYFDIIKGHHSDILNAGSGYGGTITAAMFLREFVPIKSWVHLDIAGVAWVDSPKPWNFRGATGAGVRLLVELLRNWK